MDRHLDLVREELGELVDALTPGPEAEQAFGLYFLPADHPAAELGRHVERSVFGEFFGNSPELLAAEYGAYEDTSLFLTVVDHRRRLPAGVMRVIVPSDAGLKSLADIETAWNQPLGEVLARTGLEFDDRRVWDVATLAVEKEYRGAASQGLISMALYQGLATTALRAGIGWFVTILDLVVLDLLQTLVTDPFRSYDGIEPMIYLDSPMSVPVWCDIDDWTRRFRAANPDLYDTICLGTGLEAAVHHPDWDVVVAGIDGFSPLGVPSGVSLLG